jgi:ABC-type polysaccharide/polyol phosphate export permease
MFLTIDPKSLRLAFLDLTEGIRSVHLWPMLAWMEIKQRYRRSLLGPFWLTISTGALIGGMGPLYGRLMGADLTTYFPYLAISFILWLFMASIINEATNTFIGAEAYIKQLKLPLTVHVLRMVWRNFIIFAHNLVILGLVLLVYPPTFSWALLIAPVGWFLIALNGVWVGIVLGLLSARFRDIPQVIGSVVQVAFFLTPVMWKREMLGRHAWTVEFNPFYHFLEIGRAPFFGAIPTGTTWLAISAITLGGFTIAMILFTRFRGRIAFWV